MAEFASIEDAWIHISTELKNITDKKSIALLYAFNATWKTRLSHVFNTWNDELSEEEMRNIDIQLLQESGIPDPAMRVLCYNAFIEDLFSWDNAKMVLEFKSHWVIDFIEEQGLYERIKNIYANLTRSKIAPDFNYPERNVTFYILSESDEGEARKEYIKISKSEESILIWAIFYSILEIAIEALNTEVVEDRGTHLFDSLEYIVIDDPVSSIDDARIIAIAVKLFETIESSNNPKLNFLITTHHALFYNVLFNSFSRMRKSEAKRHFYILSRNANNTLSLDGQDDATPFAYHLLVKKKIEEAIANNSIEKYHFNLLRSLLEKTANFLGRDKFSDCILWENKELYSRVLNKHSHGALSELDPSIVSNEDKEMLKETFKEFIENFKFN